MSSGPQLDAPSDDSQHNGSNFNASMTNNSALERGAESSDPSATHKPGRIPRRNWIYRILSIAIVLISVGLIYGTRTRWQPVVDTWIRPVSVSGKKDDVSGKKGDKKSRGPVVTLATVETESIPQFINCLGTVTAFNNVVIRSRVNGELIEIDFQEGQMVEEGQLLARVDPRAFEAALQQARGQLQRDQAALELARLNNERSKSLSQGDALSQQERDELEALFKQAEAVVEVDRATVANAELQLDYCTITSPIRGRVGLRVVDRGNVITANDPRGLAVITQLNPISVLFPIPQDEIPRIQAQLANTESIPVLAYDRSFQTPLAKGHLTAIDNQVDPTTGTLRIKAKFDNEDNGLFPNQFINIRMLVKQWDDAVVVPSSAIQRGDNGLYVWVALENEIFDVLPVQVAFAEAGKTVISEGLHAGQIVVIEGTDKLKPPDKDEKSLPVESKR